MNPQIAQIGSARHRRRKAERRGRRIDAEGAETRQEFERESRRAGSEGLQAAKANPTPPLRVAVFATIEEVLGRLPAFTLFRTTILNARDSADRTVPFARIRVYSRIKKEDAQRSWYDKDAPLAKSLVVGGTENARSLSAKLAKDAKRLLQIGRPCSRGYRFEKGLRGFAESQSDAAAPNVIPSSCCLWLEFLVGLRGQDAICGWLREARYESAAFAD